MDPLEEHKIVRIKRAALISTDPDGDLEREELVRQQMAPKKPTKAQKKVAAAARRAVAAATEENSGGHSGEDHTSGSTFGEDNHMVDANREDNLANILGNVDVGETARPAASSSNVAAAAVDPAEKQTENKSKSVGRPLVNETQVTHLGRRLRQ